MSDVLSVLREKSFVDFVSLFDPHEGRMGVTVTFIAILELMREGLLVIVQAEPYAPIHVRPGEGHLKVVADHPEDAVEHTAHTLEDPSEPQGNRN